MTVAQPARTQPEPERPALRLLPAVDDSPPTWDELSEEDRDELRRFAQHAKP